MGMTRYFERGSVLTTSSSSSVPDSASDIEGDHLKTLTNVYKSIKLTL
jgi:hypothetical protein